MHLIKPENFDKEFELATPLDFIDMKDLGIISDYDQVDWTPLAPVDKQPLAIQHTVPALTPALWAPPCPGAWPPPCPEPSEPSGEA